MEKPYGKEAVVEAIISAAIPLIAEHGVKAVTFRHVAEAANANHGLITRHFGSKEELIRRVGDRLVSLFFGAARISGPDNMEPLWRTIQENGIAVRAFARIIQETMPEPGSRQVHHDFLGEVVDWLQQTFGVAADRNSPTTLVIIYLLAVFFLGGEMLGKHLQLSLGLTDDTLFSVREQAFQRLFASLKSTQQHPSDNITANE
jgi:AcrR family transcriptional regulator